ncbi:midasin isoform X2 [Humulus lupulus]|uniref:midasin isoform X2 n=1 Tax=Humulus lupulus TaxID=3486 RepID=UPI002B405220|nr:midasin isoform X2 [Humulus lupulus]
MAMDKSFSLESALGRFLARCPKLLSVQRFAKYAKEGYTVTEDEVVRLLAEVFLLPTYTIPLMGCFRPIVRIIVDKAVWLIRLVPNLRSNSNDEVANFDKDRILEEHSVIEFYNRIGKGLDLHELACLAFCRALDLDPSLSGSVLSYFEFAPPPFQRILVGQPISELCVKAGCHVLLGVRASYRLLLMKFDDFNKLWDWSCFLDLVKQLANLEMSSCAESVEIITDLCSCTENVEVVCDLCSCTERVEVVTDIKWCAIKILSFVLKLSDRAIEKLGIEKDESFLCYLRWEKFCQDVSLEKAGWYISGSSRPNTLESSDFCQKRCLKFFGLDSEPICSSQVYFKEPPLRIQRLAWDHASSSGNPFVLTSAVQKTFETVSLAVSQKWPVLLYGPSGSGKTSLISKLAQLNSERQVVSIPMDDQIDGKTLLGSYVCTERPGEFRWQPGTLSQAVVNGYWVVFEDIDKAPSDVHAILLPLLEGTNSYITGHGEEIRVAENFRLFSTISTSKLEVSSIIKGGNSVSVFWRTAMLGPPKVEDLKKIVKESYPSLEPIAEKLVETFDRVKSSPYDQVNGVQYENLDSAGYLSRFSLRDLLKWCKRIAGLGFRFDMNCVSLSAYECHCIYQEAVEIFAASSTSVEHRLTIRKDIAQMWQVPPSTVGDTLYPADKPIIQDSLTDIKIGRVSLQRTQTSLHAKRKSFVEIRSSLTLLERLAASVKFNEPVLMVGETGTGKTTLVQDLALRLGQKLTVLNLSQQSDVADLLGGFKPMDAQFICFPLYKEFLDLFVEKKSIKANHAFFALLQKNLTKKKWISVIKGLRHGVKFLQDGDRSTKSGRKRQKTEEDELRLENLSGKLEMVEDQLDGSSGIIFSFVEGAFVNALKSGEWILLDEVNLAPPETLQRVIGVLDGDSGSLCLTERGDISCVRRHPNFRLFACMNPATDAGKRDLPFSLRSRFTEYFVDDVSDDEDLTLFVNKFLGDGISNPELVKNIVSFYKEAKLDAEERLQDGANQKPQYSLRSLYRALEYTRKAKKTFGFQKALYDGFCMFFQTLLDRPSAMLMDKKILSKLMAGKKIPHVPFDDYLTSKVDKAESFIENYILTKSVRENLSIVARAILVKRYPVLLQGPTSSGKTSLVRYLAAITGHEFVRINNHEHTDLQEYLGTYITDAGGKLVFHEGVLVRAVRNGCWIVLDELNLAPSDVLEALNRLLDDNRELFVPELQETVRAHPDFMLFATQNPPTVYGGRKMLSRAFRNRFVEIHVDEIPENELSTIITGRCKIPESYAKKMVDVMKELQLNRQRSKVFAGKHGYITPRDLFRWADRFRIGQGCSYDDLARDGYYLLAERLREEGEKSVIREVLEKHLRVKLFETDLYKVPGVSNGVGVMNNVQSVSWSKSMERLYFLVERCYKMKEPVLLIGETGGGKTTVCQLLSNRLGLKLHILNCHQYTETSDFLGGFYPIRERSKLMSKYKKIVEELVIPDAFSCCDQVPIISSDIGEASATLSQLQDMIEKYKQGSILCPGVTDQHVMETLEVMLMELSELHQKWQTIFMWQDGPLVHAMKGGDLFLVDEICLADDSVLERLNSVLEPERTLSLAEKGGSDLEKIVADEKFLLLATMNPGGDFGKKELSPALRNRFTEIWVPPVYDMNELRSIALQRVLPNFSCIVDPMLIFWEWFGHLQIGRMLTIRDLLSWVEFVNVTGSRLGAEYACIHGVFLVLLDGLSLGSGISKTDAGELRKQCLSFLLEQMKVNHANSMYSKLSRMQNYGWGELNTTGDVSLCDDMFGADSFYIQEGSECCQDNEFKFSAPTTCRNALRVMRAMQLSKPVLLEGSPGVGKTSLIVALGKFHGHKVVRINFSEQTDLMDLLGSDLPVESDDGMKFAWSDGILLQALKEGCWVLLDELNLAPQSVLEGLNAILDHRAEVFIPELGLTFKCPSSFRIFACQNPSYQGCGRKSLPKSFLNRFTKVYVDELVEEDYDSICSLRFPKIPSSLLKKLILFNKRLYEDTMLHHKFAQEGSPWEFNLRDVFRSCEIIYGAPDKSKEYCFLNTVYLQRMRTEDDRRQVLHLYEEIFKVKPYINPSPRVQLNSQYLIVGNTSIKREGVQSSKVSSDSLKVLPAVRQSLEAVAQCMKHQWLCILVGPTSSGKTSLIRLLAELTGNVLNELHLSSGTDISEILGCFEQYNAIRNFRFVVALVECYINEYCGSSLESLQNTLISEGGFISKWFFFLSTINHDVLSCFSSSSEEDRKRLANSLTLLDEIIQQLKLVMEENSLSLSWSSRELDRATRIVSKLRECLQKRSFSAKFEWVSGQLVKAIDRGEWIVLENANCCNPTVLDRINSLVEPLGSITINEWGIVDGKPVILHPHPNFRMFLTVNPSYGEVSRAMRNRGIEIFLMQPCWLHDESIGFSCDEFELKDVNRFLSLSGIPTDSLVQAMAKSHLYARKEGLRFNISITYLELSRWVQLFQQLLMDGNQPIWSLQLSWEYVYISSLGEANGGSTVRHAKDTHLSIAAFSDSSLLDSPLCLPGGWPMPLKLRDFVLYSRESTVKQNCMYLSLLAAQYFSCKVREKGCAMYQDSTASNYGEPSLVDVKKLHQIMLPCDPNLTTSNSSSLDVELAKKKLLFAAEWAIEQASEGDLRLYLLWFRTFSSRCQILSEFSNLVERVMKHPIWKYMINCYLKLTPNLIDDVEKFPTPVLSIELVDEVMPSSEKTKFLCNAINCVGPLKLTYRQSDDECKVYDNRVIRYFKPLLEFLRSFEEDFLEKLVDPSFMLVESPSFDILIQMYVNVLEDHICFWNNIEKYSSNGERSKNTEEDMGKLLISWRLLLKNAAKLKGICSEAFNRLLEESKKLEKVYSWNFHSEKSLLWVYGGHPILPSSALLFAKQLELLKFCESCWPTETRSLKERSLKPVENHWIETVASSNSTLRFLVMEGVSMLYCYEEELHVVMHLDEMSEFMQKLEKWVQQAKSNLEKNLQHNKLDVSGANSSTFCSFSNEILCQKSGFDSWQCTLPFVDTTSFYLDMELLQELSSAHLADSRELQLVKDWTSVSNRLKSALNFSLVFSSRPLQMFLPHQKILSILDTWTSVDAVNGKVATFVLEMWFRWHQFLWIYCPISVKEFSSHGIPVPDSFQTEDIPVPDASQKKCISVPDMLFQPVMMNTVFQILQNTTAIKDYFSGSLKLKVASCNLWRSLSPGSDLPTFFLSAVRDLFEQIIIAHQKAFDADDFEQIKSNLCDLRTSMTKNGSLKLEKLQSLRSLILSSSHNGLKMSLEKFIAPLLMELYRDCSSTGCFSNVGRAWLRLGVLRLNLLLCCDDLDPAMKYHCKDSQLSDKISSCNLEIQVRRECNSLAGWLSTREADKKQVQTLGNLEKEKRRLQRKIVFRSDYRKFKNLKHRCNEFLAHALSKSSEFLWSDIEAMSLEQIPDKGYNWQNTATAFIEKLSDDYPEYIDFVQPVQVAVYEMKLGFSLVVSSLMQKRALSTIKEKSSSSRVDPCKMNVVTESIYTFMRFPLASSPYTVSINLNNELPEFLPYKVETSADFCAADMDVLKELVSFSCDAVTTSESISHTHLEASLYQNILFRTENFVSCTHMMNSASFTILDSSFGKLADFWKSMKFLQAKTREEESQQYKFRTRAFKIASIFELDISNLGKSFEGGSSSEMKEFFSEWKELVSDDQHAGKEDACNEQDNSDEECNPLEESVLNNVVRIHDQLFGINSLIINPGAYQISTEDRFISFIDSYTIGTRIVRGLEGSFLSNLDARLAPEHLLRLCLEHEQKFVPSHEAACRFNFYKDSNALEMSKMVKLLQPLQERVYSLLKEWEDHHGLRKILNVILMLLNIPVTTPLAKVLSGLQFLVNSIQLLQENGSKFPISDQLEAIIDLVESWHKLEFGSWQVLLDEVLHQYDLNAGKLWFPLYPILLKQSSSGMNNNILSLEDFIQTSSIGEFRRRLQLLFAFLGQIHMGLCVKYYSSSLVTENLKILYNVFGFYVQFLPRTLEHIEDTRKDIVEELKALKLCSWESRERILCMNNSKKKRQKLKKLIQKYDDFLHQPVMLFINKDAEQKGGFQAARGEKSVSSCAKANKGLDNAASELTLSDDDDRFIWYDDWRKKADGASKSLKLELLSEGEKADGASKSSKPDLPLKGIIRRCSASLSTTSLSYRDAWNAVLGKLNRISRIAVDCDDLWNEENKGQQKRRALSELLKLLESTGLSRHKPVFTEDQAKSWWFLEPLHEFLHLLPGQNGLMHGASNAAASACVVSGSLPNNKFVAEWTATTGSYFKSVASVLLLQQICLNCHKDITREQVDRSGSFLHQLIEIQQKQHTAGVVFAKHLKSFKECNSILKNLYSSCTTSDGGTRTMFCIVQNQDAIFRCMWQQKKIFDCLCSISHDELLLLRTFDKTHLETCETVKAASHGILALVENFFPLFKKSKELLDNTLLGQDRDITKLPASPDLLVISKDMEEVVSKNFRILVDFENHLAMHREDANRSSVKKTLLGHFEDVLKKGRIVEEEFILAMKGKHAALDTHEENTSNRIFSELEAEFLLAIKSTYDHIKEAMENYSVADESLGSITSWKFLFESLAMNFRFEHLSNKLLRVISCGKKLLNQFGDKCYNVYVQLEHLHLFLDLMSNFGDGLLQEHLDMHKTVSAVICVLADVLASLYSKGFGICSEDQVGDASCDSFQDASGTGMGEGEGKNDVSDQITDEDQLLGASDKQNEEQNASGEVPNKNDKGIEMEQDFDAKLSDVSEDSEEDMDDDGEEQLESAMGETGVDSEVVDEKLWNKEEDENPNNSTEKYESGPSVKDTDKSSRELRAKEDSSTADEPGELNPEEVDKLDGETGKQDELCDDDGDDIDDANLDKEEAFADSTGLKPDDLEQSLEEDMDLDKEDGVDSVEEAGPEAQDELADTGNSEEENPCPGDETMEDAETGDLDMSSEMEELGKDHEPNAETNTSGSKSEMSGLGISDNLGNNVPNSESPSQPNSDLQESDSSNMVPELNWSNNNDTHSGLAPLRGLPSGNTSELDRMESELSNSKRETGDQSQTQLPPNESSSVQKNQPNPNRSHGDPYKEWKERVKVFVDLAADETEALDEIHDEMADEFGYVPESEMGTSQALGLATSEQIDSNVNSNKTNENEPTANKDDTTEMEIEKENSEPYPVKNGSSLPKSKIEDKMTRSELEETPMVESEDVQAYDDDALTGLSDGLVSVRKAYFNERVDQLNKLSINDDELGKARDPEDTSIDPNSTALWRRYELLTTRLSQELAEQLRLVMEPTLASKLQGDYKTGKRINMKKVIPYIASHFRRDKIWLRRTRPNKRDYQVVIAVDDSRSMSENCCGNVALEALVTVCRAMSQLEMGDLAVASFGKKGNIRLLHDFGQPFTGEAGVKIVSNFTFKQENTIADQPVLDLLTYLHNKLDSAVVKARLPSGQNPLQQLVLIIADGRLTEKEKLRRQVRHFLSRKRMVAFLILDSPQDSIMDIPEIISWKDGPPYPKYMDSFPFPYYIVLRNIEALPRTLADLLRQWFELMQSSKE